MSEENRNTIQFYEKHADEYEARGNNDNLTVYGRSVNKGSNNFFRRSLIGVPKNAKIFEIGSGYGRDAEFFQSLGYSVQVSDATGSFVDRLKEKGFSPRKFNLIVDDFDEKYDYILANAVLVHFKKDETKSAVQKVYDALNENGSFVLSIKEKTDEDDGYKNNLSGEKRYFSYWSEDEIRQLLEAAGFIHLSIEKRGGLRGHWLNIIARKECLYE